MNFVMFLHVEQVAQVSNFSTPTQHPGLCHCSVQALTCFWRSF